MPPTITTHAGGDYYEWRVSVVGTPPPHTFDQTLDAEGALYWDWQHGVNKYKALADYDLALAGGSIAPPGTPPATQPPPNYGPPTQPGGPVPGAVQQPPPPAAPAPAPVATVAAPTVLTVGGVTYSADQVAQMRDMYRACLDKKANIRVQSAAFTIGVAENGWDENTCNSSNHCGVFQLDSGWQAEHDYHDTYYWAIHALDSGFYGYGGLIHIEATHAGWSIGQIVEACQGAGPTFGEAASYYDGRVAEANAILSQFTGGKVDVQGVTPSPAGANNPPPPTVDTTAFTSLIHQLNWAGDFENLWKNVQGGSNEAAHMAQVFNSDFIDPVTFIDFPRK